MTFYTTPAFGRLAHDIRKLTTHINHSIKMSVVITAADVKKLRDMTGAGMSDCKKALEESKGDFDKAVEAAEWG